MATKDQKNDIKVQSAMNIAAITSNTTTDGVSIDTKGYESVTFVQEVGARTDGTFTPLIEESDTGAFSGEETAVADADLIGTEAAAASSTAQSRTTVGYVGNKRYVRFTTVSTSVTSGATVGASVILGNPHDAPAV